MVGIDYVDEVFRLPLRLVFKLEDGSEHTTSIEMTDREQTFYVPVSAMGDPAAAPVRTLQAMTGRRLV